MTHKDYDLHVAYKAVFSSQAGQEVLQDILKKAGTFLTLPEPGENLEQYEGKRTVGNHILTRLGTFSHAPEVINFITKLPALPPKQKENE